MDTCVPLKWHIEQILTVDFDDSVVYGEFSVAVYSTTWFNSLHDQPSIFS